MFSSECSPETSRFLIDYGKWHAREMTLTREKIDWMWAEIRKYPTLFSDLTKDNHRVFLDLIQDPFSYWLEIVDDDEVILGFVYVTELYRGIDAAAHLLFLDRKPSEKAELCKLLLHHVFAEFPHLHRLTATIPAIYLATIRLARKCGFVEEGRKRESQLIRHKWCDEIIFGVMPGDI